MFPLPSSKGDIPISNKLTNKVTYAKIDVQ